MRNLTCKYCGLSKPSNEFVLKLPLMKVCFDCAKASNELKGKKSISKEEFMRKQNRGKENEEK